MPKYGREIKLNTPEDDLIIAFVNNVIKLIPSIHASELKYMINHAFGKTLSPFKLHQIRKQLKIRNSRASLTSWRRDTEMNKLLRKEYCKILNSIDPYLLVFIDETHKDATDIVRRYVNTFDDTTPFAALPKQSQSVSAVVACNYFRPLIWNIKEIDEESGGVNADDIVLFLKQLFTVIPKNCIIILDNARVHRNDQVLDVLNSSGFIYMFTPPYSPDLSPIELMFSLMKTMMQKMSFGNEDVPIDTLMHLVLEQYITSNHMESFYQHCQTKWQQIQ